MSHKAVADFSTKYHLSDGGEPETNRPSHRRVDPADDVRHVVTRSEPKYLCKVDIRSTKWR